jgi:hypothetical protein
LLRESFGITLDDWAALLGRFVGLCHRAGLVLNDVEFIVGTLGPIHPPQIFLVDFDKVYLRKPASGPIESIGRLTLSQFPSDRMAFTQAYKATLEASLRDDASLLSVVTPSWLASELRNVDAAMMVSSAVGERKDRSEQRGNERSRSRSPAPRPSRVRCALLAVFPVKITPTSTSEGSFSGVTKASSYNQRQECRG